MGEHPLASWLEAAANDEANGDIGGPGALGRAGPGEEGARHGASWPRTRAGQMATPTSPPAPEGGAGGAAACSRSFRFLAVAALPWLVVGLLLWERTSSGGTAQVAGPALPASTAEGWVVGTPADLPTAFGARAALAVREAATTGSATASPSYVDLALPESAVSLGDITVVRVLALVLSGDDGRWSAQRLQRYAVPMRLVGGEGVVVDRPWALAEPSPGRDGPGWETKDTDTEPFATALADAGYSEVEGLSIAQAEGLPDIVRADFRATAPGDVSARRHAVWLHDLPQPTVVAARSRSVGAVPSALVDEPPNGASR